MTSAGLQEFSADRWYAAATLPHKERVALENLALQNFQAYCPLHEAQVRHARKTRTVHVPVFRGYVFVAIDPAAMRWRSINGTRGVRWLVSDKEGPIPIKPGVIETLLASTGEDGLLRFAPMFSPGDTVRLATGPFAERLGIIESLDDRGRVRLLFELFGRVTRLQTDVYELRPAGP